MNADPAMIRLKVDRMPINPFHTTCTATSLSKYVSNYTWLRNEYNMVLVIVLSSLYSVGVGKVFVARTVVCIQETVRCPLIMEVMHIESSQFITRGRLT